MLGEVMRQVRTVIRQGENRSVVNRNGTVLIRDSCWAIPDRFYKAAKAAEDNKAA